MTRNGVVLFVERDPRLLNAILPRSIHDAVAFIAQIKRRPNCGSLGRPLARVAALRACRDHRRGQAVDRACRRISGTLIPMRYHQAERWRELLLPTDVQLYVRSSSESDLSQKKSTPSVAG